MAAPELAKYPNKNERDGRYYQHPFTGQRVPSITSILKLVNKDLTQYAADQMLKWCIENWTVLSERSDEAAFGVARFKWTKHRDHRANVGTGVHETIEALHTGSWDFPELNEEQQAIMQQWYKFASEHEIKPVHSEYTVWDAENEYAGTADGLWYIDGVLTTVDIKTSSRVYDEHGMQLAAILNAPVRMEKVDGEWFERENDSVEPCAVLHLRDDLAELHYFDDMDLYWEEFMHYRGVWAAQEKRKARKKEREGK